MNPMNAQTIFDGSDAESTKLLYARLTSIGPLGIIATNLFRAVKCSYRAKAYRKRVHSREAYGRKNWSLGNLSQILSEHAATIGINWGWGRDKTTPGYSWVLYCDLPTGQVSFHTSTRELGPDYAGEWDGKLGESHGRVVRWTQAIIDAHPEIEKVMLEPPASLGEEDAMPWGKYHGKLLKEIPRDYWEWFFDQKWAKSHKALFAYARDVLMRGGDADHALMPMSGWVGNPDVWKSNDGTCPFDPDPPKDELLLAPSESAVQ